MHFNETRPGVETLSVIPVEEVPRKEIDELMGMYSIKDILRLHIREPHSMAKLKTLMRQGLNIRRDLPQSIPFVIQYDEKPGKISKLVKNFYEDIKSKYFCG